MLGNIRVRITVIDILSIPRTGIHPLVLFELYPVNGIVFFQIERKTVVLDILCGKISLRSPDNDARPSVGQRFPHKGALRRKGKQKAAGRCARRTAQKQTFVVKANVHDGVILRWDRHNGKNLLSGRFRLRRLLRCLRRRGGFLVRRRRWTLLPGCFGGFR